jgi:hypothetical protein
MWITIVTVLVALAIGMVMLMKALGRSVLNKPSWVGGIVSALLGLLPLYLLLCLFGFMGKQREEPEY